MKSFIKSRQFAFTLVEIMVALAIGIALVGVIIQIFLSNKENYNMIAALSKLQEEAQINYIILAREFRQITYQGCMNSRISDSNIFKITDKINIPNTIYDAKKPLSVDNNVGNTAVKIDGYTVKEGTDVLRVQYKQSCNGVLVEDMADKFSSDKPNIKIDSTNSCKLKKDDYLWISDCQTADIAQVDEVDNGIITFKSNTSATSYRKYRNDKNNSASEVYPFRSYSYFISEIKDAGGDIISTSLMRHDPIANDTIELVTNIQDMQILFGEDSNNDEIVDRYVNADKSGLKMENVVNIQASFLFSTDDSIASKPQADFPYPPTPFNDGKGVIFSAKDISNNNRRLYRVFNVSISLRNQLN
jgi:type IV pilus assembly protein PilW